MSIEDERELIEKIKAARSQITAPVPEERLRTGALEEAPSAAAQSGREGSADMRQSAESAKSGMKSDSLKKSGRQSDSSKKPGRQSDSPKKPGRQSDSPKKPERRFDPDKKAKKQSDAQSGTIMYPAFTKDSSGHVVSSSESEPSEQASVQKQDYASERNSISKRASVSKRNSISKRTAARKRTSLKEAVSQAAASDDSAFAIITGAIAAFFIWIFDWVKHDLRPKNRRNLLSRYLFPAAFFYWEIVFKLSTTRTPGVLPIIYILCFSVTYGLIFYLLTTHLKPDVNRKVRQVLLVVLSLPYHIEYFVYRQFKVLYDLTTVTAGAGGVLTGFFGDMMRLIFSPAGLLHIFLFLVPFLLYIFVVNKYDRAKKIRPWKRFHTIIATAVLFFLSVILVQANGTYRACYSSEYNFQSAVGDFGLATGLRLEVRQKLSGGKSVSFDTESTETESDAVSSEATVEAPKVYGTNALDLDFAAMAESDTGTYADLDNYVAGLTPSRQNEYTGLFKGKNLIMITAEAFSGSIIDPTLTPTLYRLSTKGIHFTDYTLQATAGTTGGEYQHVFGMLPTDGGSSMKDTETMKNDLTMGNMLSRFGYYGKAYHNNDYTYYDRNLTHTNLGYSDGFMGMGNGMEKYVTQQWPESDLEMFEGTFDEYVDKQPFNVYFMTVSGHSDYSKDTNKMSAKNWAEVENLDYSDTVKAYIAANLELEHGLEWLVSALEDRGIADDTVIVLTADHFPYGLDDDAALGDMPYLSELYGYDVENYMQRDRNTLIIWSGSLENEDPIVVDDPVSSIDILPTLANLFGTEYDSRLMPGRDVFSDTEPLVFNDSYDWKTREGTWINATKTFTPSSTAASGTSSGTATSGTTASGTASGTAVSGTTASGTAASASAGTASSDTSSSDTSVSDDYIDSIRRTVRNKINYMTGALENAYWDHVFENYTFKTETVTAASESAGSSASAGVSDSAGSSESAVTKSGNTSDSPASEVNEA